MSWLTAMSRIEDWPIALSDLSQLVDEVGLAALPDVPIVESSGSMVTSDTLLDVLRGSAISNLTVDFIVDLIASSGGRCFVLDSVMSTELYSSGVWPDPDGDEMVWSDFDAALFPFYEDAHWRLAVADLTTSTLYYMDPNVDDTWLANSFILDWLRGTGAGQRWHQVVWPAPQQRKGSADCGIAVIIFMLHVARGDGLPSQGSPQDAGPRTSAYTPGQLTQMRGRIFFSILYATLDPPSDLKALYIGLSELYLGWFLALSRGDRDDPDIHEPGVGPTTSQTPMSTRTVQEVREAATSDISLAPLCPPCLPSGPASEPVHAWPSISSWLKPLAVGSPGVGLGAAVPPGTLRNESLLASSALADSPPTHAMAALSLEPRPPGVPEASELLSILDSEMQGSRDEDDDSLQSWQDEADDPGAGMLWRLSPGETDVLSRLAMGLPQPSSEGEDGSEWGSTESYSSATQDADPDSEAERQVTVDEDDDPGTWAFLSIPSAVAIADLRGAGLCHRAVRLLQDSHWVGFDDDDDHTGLSWLVSTCPFCGQAPDDQDHGVLHCPHPALQAIRTRAFEAISIVINSLPTSHQRVAWKIADMAKGEGGYRLCLGIWTSEHLQQINHPDYVLEKDQITDVLWAVHHPLAEMVSDIWWERALLPPPPPPASYPPRPSNQLAMLRMQSADDVTGLVPADTPTLQALESRPLVAVPLADSQLVANSPPPSHQSIGPLPPPAPSHRKSKVVLLRGGMFQGRRSSGASPVAPSLVSMPPPLLGLCRPVHQLQYQVVLEADWRPPQLRGCHSAVSWLGPHFSLGLWPVSLPTLQALVDEVSLVALADTPIVESLNGLVSADALLDVASGGPISNLIVDFIGDLVSDSGVRCLVVDSVTATALYTSGQWPDTIPAWPDYDAVLLPFLDVAHWRLAVADLTTTTLYYLDPDEDHAWTPRSSVKDWLQATSGGRWQQVMWSSPQQRNGAKDCAIAVMAFMLHVARGDGLPLQGSYSETGLRVPASFTPGGLTHMRGRIFASLVYACLDPPSDLQSLSQGLSALSNPTHPYVLPPQENVDARAAVLDYAREPREAEWLAAAARGQAEEGDEYMTEAQGEWGEDEDDEYDWRAIELPEAKRARLSPEVAAFPRRVSRLKNPPRPTPPLRESTSGSTEPSHPVMPHSTVNSFSIGRQVQLPSGPQKARSQLQHHISVDITLLTDCLQALRALASPLRAGLHACSMDLLHLDCEDIGTVCLSASQHDTSATQGRLQSMTITRKGTLRLKRRRLSRFSSPPPAPSLSTTRKRHRPVTASSSSPALEPTGVGECPSLGETGPVLPVRAYPQARAGVG